MAYVDACPKGGNHAWVLSRKGISYRCAKCGQSKPAATASTADFHRGVENPQQSTGTSSDTKGIEKYIFIIIDLVLPAVLVLFIGIFAGFQTLTTNLVVATYAAICFLVLLYTFFSKGLETGIISLVVLTILSYLFFIPLITGNWQPITSGLTYLGVPPSTVESIISPIRSVPLIISCSLTANVQQCASIYGGGGNQNQEPGYTKAIEQTQYITIQYGEIGTNYQLTNRVRDDQIWTGEITISSYANHDVPNIVVSGRMVNESGQSIKMTPLSCANADENCEVGPGRPPLIVTFVSADKIDFHANTLVNFIVSVSYPVHASGSNDFPVVKDNSAVSSVAASQAKDLSVGDGPLDIVTHFSSSYYVLGTSKYNPDAANIGIFSDFVNALQKKFNFQGYGAISTIQVTASSDIDISSLQVSCMTPDGDAFPFGQQFIVGGLRVTDTSAYACTMKIPDSLVLSSHVQTIKFTTTADYNYTVTQKTNPPLVVCPSDQSLPCAQ